MENRSSYIILFGIISAAITFYFMSSLGGFIVIRLNELLLKIRYVGDLLILSTDQLLIWTSLILVVATFAIVTVRSLRPPSHPTKDTGVKTISPLGRWDNLLRSTTKGLYFKWRLSQQLGAITIETLAHQNGLTYQQAINHLLSGHLDIPEEIRDYIIATRDPRIMRSYSKNLVAPKRKVTLDADPVHVIRFLEENL